MSERATPYALFILGCPGLKLGLRWGGVGWRLGRHGGLCLTDSSISRSTQFPSGSQGACMNTPIPREEESPWTEAVEFGPSAD